MSGTISTQLPTRADAIVVGSGFAGCSAAVRLAEAGRVVVLLEEAPRLGGRATSFLDRESGERVDNGQHALFGCYRDTFDFLRRIGTDRSVTLQKSLTVSMAREGLVRTLKCPVIRPPWHLVLGLLKWNALGITDRLSVLRLGPLLQGLSRKGPARGASQISQTQTVADWLAAAGQTRRLCDWLWNPLSFAALNQSPDQAAAAPFVRVLGELFAADPIAAAIGLPTVPLDELFAVPTQQFIEARGGAVLTRQSARLVADSDNRLAGVRVEGMMISASVVISCVPWHALPRFLSDVTALGALATNAADMSESPIVTVNLWCDRSVDDLLPSSFVGLVDGPMHWIFHKGRIFGGDVSHLSIVSSGASDLLRLENAELTKLAIDQLRRDLPAMASVNVRRSVVVREPRATFSLAPGQPRRPGPRTELAGFFLAGDWTDTGLPGTIESAVRSGYAAAAAAGA